MLKAFFKAIFLGIISLAHKGLGIEGVNILLLVAPAGLIVSILRKYGASIGEEVELHSPLIIHNAESDYRNLVIGNRSYVGRMVLLDLNDQIVVGERATISMGVTLVTHIDVGNSRVKKFIRTQQGPVRIDDDAYLGANVSVFHGVNIGKCAVVGAGSIVRQDVPADCMVAGSPARVTKQYP
jgi:acetyltransferase-like isoleucine patch superfamily enzyme